MFENFSFDNLMKPDNLMAGGALLQQMGQGMQNGGGLLGGLQSMQGGGLLSALQNKKTMDALKALLAQRGGLLSGMPSGPAGSAPLAPWGGVQY